jgi:predicted DNA-binding transcriptional regulator AlpA
MELALKSYINRTQLAKELGVSVATIRNWTRTKGFPQPVTRSSKIPIYRMEDITSWLEEEKQK